MHEIHTTLTGNVAGEPRTSTGAGGNVRTVLRVAVSPRWMDRESGQWRDGQASFVNVVCWRALAENVAASVRKGEPVVVTGRLRVSTYTAADDQKRQSVEIHASSVGHDLGRGTSRFDRVSRAPTEQPDHEADEGAAEGGRSGWSAAA
ncbi:MAG TPA: single-stranded DNA-binding protein [Streptosporangiaceae bacterium]|jgi:single-strand DNA-binding protein